MNYSEQKYEGRQSLYHHPSPFPLELGGDLAELTIAYHTYGQLSETRDNVVWVCHALTANSDVADWWPHTVEPSGFLNPEKWFIVCANILGSHYGTTGPLHVNPLTGEPYYADFPKITIRDMVKCHQILADHLGIEAIHALVGSSVGGFQALEWVVQQPERFGSLILIATDAKASPWTIAIDETQRMSIMADSSWGERRHDAAMSGLAAARAIGLLSYRGPEGYNLTQQDEAELPAVRRACSYQRYQGEKLCRRYNAYSYVSILDAFDTHDVGRGRGGTDLMLTGLTMPTIVIGLTTDIIFPTSDMRRLAERIPGAVYHEISSPFGHDGFLVEHTQLNRLLIPFMDQTRQRR